MQFYTGNEQETERLGAALGERVKPGTIIAYYGDLGAGKTAFTRGLARGLGIQDRITSPTYNIVNEYEGRIPLIHFDMYRLESTEDLFDIGWEDYLTRGGVIAVEWSERVEDALEGAVVIDIRKDAENPEGRIITITGGEDIADLSF